MPEYQAQAGKTGTEKTVARLLSLTVISALGPLELKLRISSRAISQAQANAAASSFNTAARSGWVSFPARIAKKYCGMSNQHINFGTTVE
jgi:hypothetical protein